jgi:hypothetical protein
MMRAFSLSIVRDEEDMIEAFVRHHAPLFERMIIVCHRCSDRTEEILTQLKEEGMPLDIRQSDAAHHAQANEMTTIIADIRASGDIPDWIFLLDADEFLIGNIEALNPAVMAVIPWRTYVPTTEDNAGEPHVLRKIRHRRSVDPENQSKIALPRAIIEASPLTITAGNHEAKMANGWWPAHARAEAMHIAHFPVRSAQQIELKARRGWESVRMNPAKQTDEAFHWKAMAEHFVQNGSPSASGLTDLALRYGLQDEPTPAIVLDPVECSFELRYGGASALQETPR